MESEELTDLLNQCNKGPWIATAWGVQRRDAKYIVQETDLTYGLTPDYQLMALAPYLAEEVIKLRKEVASLKEAMYFCSGSCHRSLR